MLKSIIGRFLSIIGRSLFIDIFTFFLALTASVVHPTLVAVEIAQDQHSSQTDTNRQIQQTPNTNQLIQEMMKQMMALQKKVEAIQKNLLKVFLKQPSQEQYPMRVAGSE